MSADRILSQILGNANTSGFGGAFAGSLAGGLLTSKAGRKLGKKALQVGGIVAVAGLAYSAWSRYRQDARLAAGAATGAHAPTPSARFLPSPDRPQEAEALGQTLLRAMIAAAQADGRLDAREHHAIHERVRALDLSPAEKEELLSQLERPVDLNALVAAARTPELATEIYTASLLAIDPDTTAERAYLTMLAARLGLPEALVEAVHRELGAVEAGAGEPRALQAAAP